MKRDPSTDAANFFSFARDYLHGYMPKVQGRTPKTIEAYRIGLECFLEHLTDIEHIERSHVSFDHFERHYLKGWLAWMAGERGYAPRTIALRLSTMKAFLAYSAQEDITLVALSQAAKGLKPPACPRTPIEYLVAAETQAVLGAFDGARGKHRRNRMLLILLYDTAARVGEITALTLQDLHLAAPGYLTLTGKRNKTRTVPLSAKTIEHLRVYLDEFHPDQATLPAQRPLFYSVHHGQPTRLSVDTVSAVLKEAATTARSTCPSIPRNIHCHMLRRTKAMDLYQEGIPLPIIMRLLGHESASTTTAFYAFATLDMMREAINAATPALTLLEGEELSDDRLKALYRL